MYFKFCNGK